MPETKPIDIMLEGLKPRFADPFISTFTFSFIFYNYQILIYIFSNLEPKSKVEFIHDSLNNFPSFLNPLVFTLAILLAIPKILLWMRGYSILENNRADLKNITYEAERNITPFKAKIDELNNRIKLEIDKNNQALKTFSEKDQKIGQLIQQISDKEKEASNLKIQLSEKSDRLEKMGEEIALFATNRDENREQQKKPLSENTSAPAAKRSNAYEQILKSFNLPVTLLGNIRDFAEENNQEPKEVTETYKKAALVLSQAVADKNKNSKIIATSNNQFRDCIQRNSLAQSLIYIDEMLKGTTLRVDEITSLKLAKALLENIIQYLR